METKFGGDDWNHPKQRHSETQVKKILFGAMALAAGLSPALAEAAEGYATANVNMRSGPSTAYPAVTVIPVGAPIEIHGCLADVPWCDVSFIGGRGWVAGRYVQTVYQQNRVYLEPRYYRPLGIPTVTFSVGTYWDRYYRNRDFYRDRHRWDRGPDRYDPDRRPDRRPDRFEPDRRPDRFEPDRRPDRFEPDRRPDRFDRDRDRDREQSRDRNRDRNRDQNRDNRSRETKDDQRRQYYEEFLNPMNSSKKCRAGDPNCP